MAQTPGPVLLAGVDVGGTFTDVVALHPGVPPRAIKVPTTPDDQSEGLAAGLTTAAPGAFVDHVAHGTTTATNAVLERAVARTVLVTTEGFRDLLTIGRQDRPSLYDLSVLRPPPLVATDHVVVVHERMGPDGVPVIALSQSEVSRVVEAVAALEPEAIAVCLLFAYAGSTHEQLVCEALADRLDAPITQSSQLLPEFREYERASTCVLDAAVAPVMRRYLGRLRERLPDSSVTVMTSSGGVADLDAVAAAPVSTLLSGPAAGVVAAAAVGRSGGFPDALAFDMGGTSTDVCLIRDGRPQVATEASIGGLPFGTPSIAVETVGAGGGSIADLDAGGALRVGPRSAGAVPGPACYGRGGTDPTVTDAHAALGHLLDGQVLGSSGLHLDRAAAERALASLDGFDGATDAAVGILTVVRATMLRALRRVSTERGVDPRGLALVAYGGAGPLHATGLAKELGCAAAVIPPAPGVLSALGLLLAPPRREASRTVMAVAERGAEPAGIDHAWANLAAECTAQVADARVELLADCRYAGQSHELRVPRPDAESIAAAFDAAHHTAYGYSLPDEPVEIVTLRAVAQGMAALAEPPGVWDFADTDAPPTAEVVIGARQTTVDVHRRGDLAADDVVRGPALVVQPDTTMLLETDDLATVAPDGSLVVRW